MKMMEEDEKEKKRIKEVFLLMEQNQATKYMVWEDHRK